MTMTIIIGAGAAGLTCAKYLKDRGVNATILEASDAVGGRVRTDIVDGFRLDRGFQVMMTSYPEARRLLDFDALKLQPVSSGARIRHGDGFFTMPNPLKDLLSAPQALFSPVGSLFDKFKVLQLSIEARDAEGPETIRSEGDVPTIDFLREYGYSDTIIEKFFLPFFRGVFLDRDLQTRASLFRFLFGRFATGDVVVPESGMQAIPEQIASHLAPEQIRLSSPVKSIDGKTINLMNGESIEAETIVVATDGRSGSELLGEDREICFNGTICLYFESDRSPADETPYLSINSNSGETIDHAIAMSEVAPSYAPAGKTLVSVSIVGSPDTADEQIVDEVRNELGNWFGRNRLWRHLRTYRISDALPSFLAGTSMISGCRIREGVYRCGDYVYYPSLNGAMKAGREVAEMIAG